MLVFLHAQVFMCGVSYSASALNRHSAGVALGSGFISLLVWQGHVALWSSVANHNAAMSHLLIQIVRRIE